MNSNGGKSLDLDSNFRNGYRHRQSSTRYRIQDTSAKIHTIKPCGGPTYYILHPVSEMYIDNCDTRLSAISITNEDHT